MRTVTVTYDNGEGPVVQKDTVPGVTHVAAEGLLTVIYEHSVPQPAGTVHKLIVPLGRLISLSITESE